jgi:glucosamine 6-phosphate synthetase-like amidotransferase/phosphosugar isomerase protein
MPRPHPLLEAIRESLRRVIGTYGIAVMPGRVPGVLFGRGGEPLVLGVGKGEFLASDVCHRRTHQEAVYLNDYEYYTKARRFRHFHAHRIGASFQVNKVEFMAEDMDKGKFPRFHAQGDLRAAEFGAGYHARKAFDRRRRRLGGLEMSNARASP